MTVGLIPECPRCEAVILVDETYIYDRRDGEPIGPYHYCCAVEECRDDPQGFSMDEPEPREPDDDDYNRRMEMAEDSAARYAQELRDAGRGHLLR